ncbi:hypothetical protein D3C77_15800 [compost metagenome]
MLCRNTLPYIVVVQLRRKRVVRPTAGRGSGRRVRAAAQGDISLPDINLALNRRL